MTRRRDPQGSRAKHVPLYATTTFARRRHTACVLIPVVNEGQRLTGLLARMAELRMSEIVDVVIVDGGSADGSTAPGALAAAGVRALLVKAGPPGLGAQLRCGFDFALRERYREIVTIDGNGKDDPAPIAAFVEAVRDGVDFVQGSRFVPGGVEENTPWRRRLAIRWVHAPLLSWASGFAWTDTTQGFRAYSARLLSDPRLDVFRSVFEGYELLPYLNRRAPRLGFRCIERPSIRRYPSHETPTKISGLGELRVLWGLLKTCLGAFDPIQPRASSPKPSPPRRSGAAADA